MSDDLAARIAGLTPEKRALLAQRMKTSSSRSAAEPIAIVGMGCRFPGADGPDAFWELIRNGVDAIGEVPADRWDIAALYDADASVPGTVSTKWGGFLNDVDRFDAPFFGISPREAARMDPQQRLLLEVAWNAIEHAGQTIESLKGSRTGVFVGAHSQSSDYGLMQFADPQEIDTFTATGTALNFLAGRLSYLFDLQGPSIVVDTACSSSLVAVHLACQSLRSGESAMAVAGGVNMMLTPHFTIAASRMRLLAPDGRCKAFDDRANGFVRGEGCGIVVLKRLADARAAGDRIVAVIRGSAINQDGRTNGITAPNGSAQRAAIREALRAGGVEPSRVGYVEAHGTGTALGDPIEVESLALEVGQRSHESSNCALGSVKANIGHLEGAAGVAGLIKAALCLQHGQIPPVVHFTKLNPHIDLSGTRLEVPSALRAWPAGAEPRIAGVSSFGWSGTNSHAVLEEFSEASATTTATGDSLDGLARLFPLSAGSPEALAALSARYADWLTTPNGPAWPDLLQSASLRRSHFESRLAVVAANPDDLATRLRAHASGSDAGAIVGRCAADRGGTVFVFPGQGSQWLGMGRQLLVTEPAFRDALAVCDRAIEAVNGWSVLDELAAGPDRSRLSLIDIVQPTLFAVSVALAALWRSWGIEPDAVVGHSMGEVAAAHTAGALSIEDAARIICLRSRLLRTVSGQGAMAAVELSFDEATAALAGYEDRLSVAVNNSRRSTVISGDPAALELLMASLRDREVFCRPVKVDVASHSPQMDPLRETLLEMIAGIRPVASRIPIYSTVLDRIVKGEELADSYWSSNLREPVRFASSIERLIADGHTNFVEVSPHPILLPAIETTLQDSRTAAASVAVASLRRDEDERSALLTSLAHLYVNGAAPKWTALVPSGSFVGGPSYPWQRERFWLEAPVGTGTSRAQGHHPVPGPIVTSGSERICAIDWAPRPGSTATALRVGPDRLVPAAILIDLVFETGAAALGVEISGIRDVEFLRPLTLNDTGGVFALQVTLGVATDAGVPFGLALRDGTTVLDLLVGVLDTSNHDADLPPVADVATSFSMDADAFYRELRTGGVDVDPALQVVEQAERQNSRQRVSVRLPQGPARARRIAMVESALQALAASVAETGHQVPYVPARIGSLRYRSGPGESAVLTTRKTMDAVSVSTNDGAATYLAIEDAVFKPRGTWSCNPAVWLHELAWQPVQLPLSDGTGARASQSWLIVNDAADVAQAIAAGLIAAGHQVRRAATLDQLDALLRSDAAITGVIDCSAIDLRTVPGESVESSLNRIDAALRKAIGLVQQVAAYGSSHPPRLWWLTRGAQPVPASTLCDPAASPLWGLGRVVAEEHAEIWGGIIDLDPQLDTGDASSVVTELTGRANEHQVAFRHGLRYAARFVAQAPAPAVHIEWRRDASYLITGGLTGVGLRVADWMLQRGARHLVLAGRTALPPRHTWSTTHAPEVAARIAGVRMLESRGATVHLLTVDVSNEADMRAALDGFHREGWPSIRGVVHSAAVIDDALIANLNMEGLSRVLAPKIGGALVLDRLFADTPLDFFVLFSSIGSVLGQSGQASYAAANAYLDALAHARSSRGLPGQAINWAGWRGLGLADTSQGARRTIENLERSGIGGFEPTEGLEALWRVMSRRTAQAIILPLDRGAFRQSRWAAADPLLFAELVPAGPAATTATGDDVTDLRTRLTGARPDARRGLLETFLQSQLSHVLKLPLERIDVQQPLGALGLESLLALEFRNRLEPELKIKLSATVVWNHPTVRSLATYLAGRLDLSLEKPADLEAVPSVPTVTAASTLDAVEELSEDAALAALLQTTQRPR